MEYVAKWADEESLWDELAALAWLDASIITKEQTPYMDIDISHNASYGNTPVWIEGYQPGLGERLVHAQEDLKLDKFNQLVIDLLSKLRDQPTAGGAAIIHLGEAPVNGRAENSSRPASRTELPEDTV